METHGLKHHYHQRHHHHQPNQQHPAINSSTYGIGQTNSPSSTTAASGPKISSTAFPLLLSSIESGRQNFQNSPFTSSPTAASIKSTNHITSGHNGTGLSNPSTNNTYFTGNSLHQFGLVNANKQRPADSTTNHQNGNGGVKATSKSKAVATPNLVTNSGRHQANFAHNANGHSKLPLTATDSIPSSVTSASSSLPFKKSLTSREFEHNNCRNRCPKCVTNSTSPLPSAATKKCSVRSICGSTKQANKVNHNPQYNHCDTISGGGGCVISGGCNVIRLPTHKDLDKSSHNHTNDSHSHHPLSGITGQENLTNKPKEFKFFKEKAKDNQQPQPKNALAKSDNEPKGKQAKSSKSNKKSVLGGGGDKKVTSACGVDGEKKKKTKVDKSTKGITPIRTKCSKHVNDVLLLGDKSDEGQCASDAKSDVDNDRPVRVIVYTEYLIDNFALHAFSTPEDLICSVKESNRKLTSSSPFPVSIPANIDNDNDDDGGGEEDNCSDATRRRPLTPSERVIFERRSPSPLLFESDVDSDSATTVQSGLTVGGLQSPLSITSSLHSPSPVTRNKSKSPKRASSLSSTTKKSNKSANNSTSMAKDSSKTKKVNGKQESVHKDDSIDEDSDEDLEQEEQTSQSQRVTNKKTKSTPKTAKCTHKRVKNQSSRSKCLIEKKKSTKCNNAVSANSSKKQRANVGRKSKCKKSTKSKEARKNVSNKSKTRKSQRLEESDGEKEDISDAEDEEEEDDSEEDNESENSSEDDEVDDSEVEDDDSAAPSDSADSDDSEWTEDTVEDNRTIADLIKCSNRREAVRKAAARAASMASVSSRNKANRTGTEQACSSTTTATSCSDTTTNDADHSDGKRKLKRIQSGKLKSQPAGRSKTKRSTSSSAGHNKRSHSEMSDQDEDDDDEDRDEDGDAADGDDADGSDASDDKESSSVNVIVNSKRGSAAADRRGSKKAVNKSSKNIKKCKELADDSEPEGDEEDDVHSDDDESDDCESPSKECSKNIRRTLRSKSTKKKVNNKATNSKTRRKKVPSEDEDESEGEVTDENNEDEEDEEEDQNMTEDAEDDDEEEFDEQSIEKAVAATSSRKGKPVSKTRKGSKQAKATKVSRGRKQKSIPKARAKKLMTLKKKAAKPKADQKKYSTPSEDETEESDNETTETNDEHTIKQSKNKCDKYKVKGMKECSGKPDGIKDVYTFELSPAEVPTSNGRFVLASTDTKSRNDNDQIDTDQSSPTSMSTNTPVTSTAITTNAQVKSSFSPKSHSNGQELSSTGLSYEPLRPDTFSHLESSFGPNASLSSLSQLSQSIGGGGTGPILLNHQNANNKCPISIKEEPKDEHNSVGPMPSMKGTSVHHTAPQSADHHASSQNFSTNFVCAKNGHPRRLWSNASAGSLISSSSSSSSSPVHPAFGHCPPTPATPASLASYFTPASLPAMTPSPYSSQNHELLRRELDSRLLASVHDRSLLPPSLAIPPPGPLTPIPTPTPFNHTSSSPMLSTSTSSATLSSTAPYLPNNAASLYPLNSNMPSPYIPGIMSPIKPLTPYMHSIPNQHPVSVVTSTSSKPSSLSIPTPLRPKSQVNNTKKGFWNCMHIKIAWEIYQKRKSSESKSGHSSSCTSKPSLSKSTLPKSNKILSSRSSSEQSPVPNNHSSKSSSNHMKNSLDSLNGQSNSLRSSSATTFTANYPPRYGTPLGNSSMSAPPMLPGLFPPPMQLQGLMPDVWPRPPLPGSMPAPLPNRGPFSFPEFYASMNSASSALTAWAAGIKPPGDALTNHNSIACSSPVKSHEKSSSSGHKRKHESSEKERASYSSKLNQSTSYQNGDIRNELPNKKFHSSSSKHSLKSDGSNSRRVYENGDNIHSHKMKTVDAQRNAFSTTPAPSALTPPMFGSFGASEHQRYIDLLGGMAPLGAYSQPNPYLTPRTNADLSSRPLWHFGMPPPPPLPSTSSSVSSASSVPPPSALMPDPFKSLQDISLRPGLVTPDRETLFSRYSLLNSSGGGASIFDKLNKEQLEKYEMMQNKPSQASSNSKSVPNEQPMSTSSSSSSRSTASHMPPVPPPPTSISSAAPPPSTPFPYPPAYLNPLHHLGPPPCGPFLQQSIGPSYPNPAALMNGTDAISKMSLGPHAAAGLHFPGGLSNESQFMLPSPYTTRPPSPRTMNFLKATANPGAAAAYSTSTR